MISIFWGVQKYNFCAMKKIALLGLRKFLMLGPQIFFCDLSLSANFSKSGQKRDRKIATDRKISTKFRKISTKFRKIPQNFKTKMTAKWKNFPPDLNCFSQTFMFIWTENTKSRATYRGGGNSAREKITLGKILSDISGQYFFYQGFKASGQNFSRCF